jgi:hypothetical protein
MPWAAFVTVIVLAACAAPSGGSLAGPIDGGPETGDAGATDAGDGGMAPIDARPVDGGMESTNLAQICGGTAPVTLDQWEDCYARRKCEWRVGCVSLTPFRDVQDCVALADSVEGGRLAAERRDRARAVAQGRASINVEAFTHCLIRTSATRCNTALFDPACLTRFTGTIPDGAGCHANIDCASPDAVCASDCPDACCVGTCQRKFREGEACLLFASCEPGLRCNATRCVSGDIGTACFSVNDCDFDAFCDPQTRRCRPRLATGASCTSILQCGGDNTCIGLSIVSSDPGQCLRNAQPGDPCDDLCKGNLYCDGSGTCRNLPRLGDSCSTLVPCAGASTTCKNGVCTLRSDVGASCGAQTCLPGLFCTSELGDSSPVCAARRADGAPCASPRHCESFLCSGASDQPGVCLPWSNTCPEGGT